MAAKRRRNAAGVGLLVFLLLGVLVAVGLFAADRYALGRTERESAAQLRGQLGTPTVPTVEVEGWPFLTQVLARDLKRVHVVADGIGAAPTAASGSTVRVSRADLVLTDVTSSDWFQTMTAQHVEGTALMEYAELGSLSSVPLTYAGDGRLRVEQSTSFFGASVTALVTGTPRLDVDAQTIILADPTISVAGIELPEATAAALLRALVKPIPVTGLPFNLTLSSLAAEDDGLHAGLEGNKVDFHR
ncbi:DUF2993 domain-containing protein [uncultured Friedmanniella sp.]|uniref:LmeA family phospholipid-binding protein n=1 Tax=uncultured Friedmanniella sp. TaxID=335381 RepID=UPI0035C9AAC8